MNTKAKYLIYYRFGRDKFYSIYKKTIFGNYVWVTNYDTYEEAREWITGNTSTPVAFNSAGEIIP